MSLHFGPGCCAKCPLEVQVGRLAHAAEVRLSAGCVDSGNQAGVAGELSGGGGAIDRADLPIDDDGQDVGHTREGLQPEDGRGEGNSLPDALLKQSDLALEGIQRLELLGDAPGRLWGKLGEDAHEPDPASASGKCKCHVCPDRERVPVPSRGRGCVEPPGVGVDHTCT